MIQFFGILGSRLPVDAHPALCSPQVQQGILSAPRGTSGHGAATNQWPAAFPRRTKLLTTPIFARRAPDAPFLGGYALGTIL